MKEPMKNRTIRMTDSQWNAFKLMLGGDAWLRAKADSAAKKMEKSK